MKKSHKLFLTVLSVICISNKTFSQADAAGPAGHIGLFPAWYVGWNAGTAFPLNLQHLGAQNINFRINYATAGFGFGNRMIIVDGGFGLAAGRIAMGNDFPDGFVPQGRLRLMN